MTMPQDMPTSTAITAAKKLKDEAFMEISNQNQIRTAAYAAAKDAELAMTGTKINARDIVTAENYHQKRGNLPL
ncbi:MAG: hypothetical protein ACRCV5_19925 [Afipia sp.]